MVYSDDIEDRIDQISAFLETHYTDVPNRRWASLHQTFDAIRK